MTNHSPKTPERTFDDGRSLGNFVAENLTKPKLLFYRNSTDTEHSVEHYQEVTISITM